MILGIGIDLMEIEKIEKQIQSDVHLRKVFTPAEIRECKSVVRSAERFAGRFAAKEATMKALGTGHARGVLWRDIEVFRHGGPPQLRLSGGALRHFEAMRARRSLLTITHAETLAMAQVLLLSE